MQWKPQHDVCNCSTYPYQHCIDIAVCVRKSDIRSIHLRQAGTMCVVLSSSPFPPLPLARMVADPRISDKELAAINAAAVTREYSVQPHLGEESPDDLKEAVLSLGVFCRLPYRLCY